MVAVQAMIDDKADEHEVVALGRQRKPKMAYLGTLHIRLFEWKLLFGVRDLASISIIHRHGRVQLGGRPLMKHRLQMEGRRSQRK